MEKRLIGERKGKMGAGRCRDETTISVGRGEREETQTHTFRNRFYLLDWRMIRDDKKKMEDITCLQIRRHDWKCVKEIFPWRFFGGH